MSDALFQTTVQDLWASLNLAPPKFGPADAVTLVVEDISVKLRHGEDGETLVIEGQGGTLSRDSDSASRLKEMELVLKTNLALTLSHQTLTTIKQTDDGPDLLIVTAHYSYAENDLNLLSELISDLVSSVETYQAAIIGNASSKEGAFIKAGSHHASEDALVFRP